MFPRKSHRIFYPHKPQLFFDPFKYAAPSCWFKTTDVDLSPNNPIMVDTIRDISGNSQHLPAQTTASRVAWSQDGGFGSPAMTFVPSACYHLSTLLPVTGANPRCTILVIGGYRTLGGYYRVTQWGESGSHSNGFWSILTDSATPARFALYVEAGPVIFPFAASASLDKPDVYIYQYDGSDITVMLNGSYSTSTYTLNTNSNGTGFTIGSNITDTFGTGFDFYELAVMPSSFTIAELQEMNALLQRQYKTGR